MASIYTNYVNGKRLRVDYSSTQDKVNNKSTVTLRAYKELISGVDGAPGDVYKARLTINGVSLNISMGVPIMTESVTYLGQYSRTISHNNDGEKSIYIQGYFETIGASTNNTLYKLPTIPQYATFTEHYVYARTVNSVTIHWNTNNICDQVQYSIGSGWVDIPYLVDYTVSGLNPNTPYQFTTRIKRADSQLWTESNTIYATTYDIAKITGANNINDEQNPYMTFTNPSGAKLLAFIQTTNPNSTFVVRDNIPNTGNYTFVLTQAEKNIIYAKCENANSTTIKYGIATKVNDLEIGWHLVDKTISIINANPTFNNFTYMDTNATTVALTGSNQKVVKGYSNIKATVSSANKAIAKKSASMSKYTFITGAKPSVDGTYSSSVNVDMTINGANGNVASIYAIDSRNNSTKKDIPVTLIDYAPINIQNLSALRGTGGIGTAVTLSFDGYIWNNNFGIVQNEIVSATYRYKKTTDSEWINGTTNIIPVLNENSYSKSVNITGDLGANGFDSAYSYNIEIEIKDKLSTTLLNNKTILQSAKPQQAFGIGEGVSFGGFYDTNEGGDLQLLGKDILNLIFPIGRGFIDFTDTDYSNYLGLTWERDLVGMFPVGKDTSQIEFNTIGKTGGAKTHTLTVNEMPANFIDTTNAGSKTDGYIMRGGYSPTGNYNISGIGASHNNLPPYQVVNYWKRVA